MAEPNDPIDRPPAGVRLCLGDHRRPCMMTDEHLQASRDHSGVLVEIDFDDPEHRRYLRYLRSFDELSPVSAVPAVGEGFREGWPAGHDEARRSAR